MKLCSAFVVAFPFVSISCLLTNLGFFQSCQMNYSVPKGPKKKKLRISSNKMKLSLQILKVKKEKVRNAGNGPHPYRVSRARPAFTQPWLHGRGRGVSLDLIFDDGPHSAQRSGLVFSRDSFFSRLFYYFVAFTGVLPHVPKMLPVLISDPEMRQKVEDTFTSQEFMDNLENYFVENIKVMCRAQEYMKTFHFQF